VGASTPVDADAAKVDPNQAADATSSPAEDVAAPAAEVTVTTGCPAWAKPIDKGIVGNPEITEASGIAASRKHANVLWVHNDSGDKARIFALDHAGATLATFTLAGTDADDWEDIAVGPGPKQGESYVCVGDIGDNGAARKSIQVYRVAEPDTIGQGGTLKGVDKLKLHYPDMPHNAETLLVDPRQGDVYVVVKAKSGQSNVFRAAAPWQGGDERTLTQVATLQFGAKPLPSLLPTTTGGDISAAGDLVAIRTYDAAYVWQRGPEQTLAEALAGKPCPLPLPGQLQGESLGFAADGQGYWTLAEGEMMPLWFIPRL
jgi:hypothetical protein